MTLQAIGHAASNTYKVTSPPKASTWSFVFANSQLITNDSGWTSVFGVDSIGPKEAIHMTNRRRNFMIENNIVIVTTVTACYKANFWNYFMEDKLKA